MKELKPTERDELITLGKLRWDSKRIATFFGWDWHELQGEMENPDSEISCLLMRGELQADFEVESRLLENAKNGDVASARHFSEVVRDRSFRMSKLDIFGGAESPRTFEEIQQYLASGCPGEMSTKEQLYIDILQIVYSFNVKFGDRKTLKLLTKPPYSLNYERGKSLISEAIELFAGGRRNSKEALRNHIAESYDTLYQLAKETAHTPQELVMASSILDKKVKLLQLDKPDETILPPEQYRQMYRVLSLTTESLGLPPANRDELGAQLDALDLDERSRARLKMEAGIEDLDIVKILRNGVEEDS